ncbi:MAG: ABC transporter permease [Malacoplasma sp.]
MFILIKQVLKSLKQSAMLVAALIFISIITIFISFSGLYINSNISTSLNTIRSEGNASDVIIEKKYDDSNFAFTYDTKPDGESEQYISNYKYDSTNVNNNIIFPYSSSDFTNAKVNDKWTLQPNETKPTYYDEYLPRYANRKKGINRALTGTIPGALTGNGASIDVGTSFRNWYGIGYSMTNIDTKEKLFDPQYLIFSGDVNNPNAPKKIAGYFNGGNVNNVVYASESAFVPNKASFTDTDIGVAKLPTIPLHKNIIRGVFFGEGIQYEYAELYSEFVNILTKNSSASGKNELIQHYDIVLNKTELTGINKFIWEKMEQITDPNYTQTTGKELTSKEKILIIDFNKLGLIKDSTTLPEPQYKTSLPIRKLWIDEYNTKNNITDPLNKEALEYFLGNRVSQLQDSYKHFIQLNRDYFIEDYLFNQGYEFNNNKSFSFFDRETKTNFLISEKNSTINKINNKPDDWINKLVLSGSSLPFEDSNTFSNFYDVRNSLTNNLYPLISPDGIENQKSFYAGMKVIINFLLKSTMTPNNAHTIAIFNEIKPTLIYINENIKFDETGELILPQTTDPTAPGYLMPGMMEKLFAWFEFDLRIGQNNFNNYEIVTVLKEGVSVITSRAYFYAPNFSSYQVVVNDKFLQEFNKEIIPSSMWNDLIKKDYTMFNEAIKVMPEKYKVKVGKFELLITGTGTSPEMAYPSPSLSSIIINPSNDILLYLDKYGYETIRNSYIPSYESNYFAIDTKLSKNYISIDKLNEDLMPIMNDGKEKVCYSISNIFSAENILTLRYSFPDILQSYISIFSIIAVVSLIVVGLYLSFIVMKKYIDKNRVQIALCKANGFSTFKIALGLSSISIIVAIIGGLTGYLIAYFLQSLIYSIIAPYMFIPTLLHVFSPLGLFTGIFIIALLFFLFVYINLYVLFRKPINLIIAQNVEIKSNKLLNILKYQQLPMTANLKFKFAISLSNIPRTFFYLTSCFIGVTVISFGLSFVSKFSESQELTDLNNRYTYSIDLVSPNEQSGLIKLQDYSEVGFSDPSLGIVPIYPDTLVNGPFPYIASNLKVLNIDGTQKLKDGRPLYFSNIVLPSRELYNVFSNDIDIFRNSVFSKWLLDFEIPFLNINVWETVKGNFPSDFIAKIESQNQIFLNAILNTPVIGQEFRGFAEQTNNIWRLNGGKILSKQTIGNASVDVLSPTFLTFVGKVYGDESLSNLDVKLSYGSTGYEKKTDETYTYINGLFLDQKLYSKNDNKLVKFFGINPNSRFVTLHNNSKEFIGHKLDEVHEDPSIKYIIINNGASLKYGLGVGDRINLSVQNSFFKNSANIFDSLLNSNLPANELPINILDNKQTFEIIDIASTSFGEDFFISQKNANNILGYDKGQFVLDINTNVGTPPAQTTYSTDRRPYLVSDYVPFNGIYSKSLNPIILSNALSYYSFINLYGNFLDINNGAGSMFYRLVETSDNNLIVEAITPWSDPNDPLNLFDKFNKLMKEKNPSFVDWTRETLKDEILKLNGATPLLVDYIINNFGNDGIQISLKGFNSYYTTQDVYSSMVSTLTLIQTLLVSLIIPLVSIIILIMSSIMLDEIKRMIFIFKTLGYSDKQNIANIIFNFVPIYIVSIAIGLLISFLLFLSMQYLIYFITAIYISSAVNIVNWVYASLAVMGIIFVNIIFTIAMYKKDKLSLAMKNDF